MGLRGVLLLVFLLVLALPGGADGRKTAVDFGWVLAPAKGTQKWIRITNTDDTNSIQLASVHGITFNISSVVSVRASGAPTPSCTVSTVPTTFDYLYCNGNLPPDSSLLLVVDTNGTGGDFEIAASDSVDPTTLDYVPDTQTGALLPVTASLTKTSTTTKQVSFTSGGNAFDEVEVLPQGFTVTKVDSITPAGSTCDTEGPGLDCGVTLPANATGTITFEATDQASTPTADVILSGDDGIGDAFVTQTQGAAATYDLATKAQPSVVTYTRGKKAATHPIRFTVSNAGSASIASSPVTVTESVSGNSAAKLFHATLSCQPNLRTMPSLKPGKSATACALAFKPSSPVARTPGRLNVTVAVACSAPETNCANNRARATIVVK